MNKAVLAIMLVLVITFSIVAGVLLVDWEGAEEEPEDILDNLYTFPLSVEEETYIVTVRSNYSSAPEVGYSGYAPFPAYHVSIDFRGDPENSFCNITIPTHLLWGNISVIDKYYEMSADRYTLSNNGTHNSVYFTFNHPALVKHFEIQGTEGISEVPSDYPFPSPTPTPTPISTPTPSPTLTPTGSYDKSIIVNTDTAEEENALSVTENINYTSIFKVERFYSVGGSGSYNYTWANFIDKEVLKYYEERFESLKGQPRNMTFSYEANVYSWNQIDVVYASSTYPIQVVSSNGTILFRNANYTGVNFGMRFFSQNDSGYQEIQASQINFSFTTSYVVEMKLKYSETYNPLAGYMSNVYQIIIVDEQFEPLFLCFTADNLAA